MGSGFLGGGSSGSESFVVYTLGGPPKMESFTGVEGSKIRKRSKGDAKAGSGSCRGMRGKPSSKRSNFNGF